MSESRTPFPKPVAPSPWDGFRTGGDPHTGPVAVGGDLSPATLVGAYRIGLFPWPTSDPILNRALDREYGRDVRRGDIPSLTPGQKNAWRLPWWSPDPRGILTPESLHVSRSLKRHMRRCGWTTTMNRSFREVMENCVRGEEGRWITKEMIAAFSELHELGYAHSLEVWDQTGRLAGGLYGVLTGCLFDAESMFSRETNGSKVALMDLAWRMQEAGGLYIDTQTITEHLITMGAFEMKKAEFHSLVLTHRDAQIRLLTDELPVARLAKSEFQG